MIPGPRLRALAGLALLAASGCVSSGAHQRVVAERDRLARELARREERIRVLEGQAESLAAERLRLAEENEELRERSGALSAEVELLRRERDATAEELEAREREVAELARLRRDYDALVQDLQAEIQEGRIAIERLRDGMQVSLPGELLFEPGRAVLGPEGVAVIRRVAEQLRGGSHRIEVQGHTDATPLAKGPPELDSNWDLACARAARVVELLVRYGVEPERLSAVSFAEFRPVADNDTPEGRRANRRIEIRLRPGEGGPAPKPRS